MALSILHMAGIEMSSRMRAFSGIAYFPLVANTTAERGDHPMSEANEANKALVRRYIEMIDAGALDRLEEFIAPEYVNHTMGTRGPDGY
jgi:hypothetical protein